MLLLTFTCDDDDDEARRIYASSAVRTARPKYRKSNSLAKLYNKIANLSIYGKGFKFINVCKIGQALFVRIYIWKSYKVSI